MVDPQLPKATERASILARLREERELSQPQLALLFDVLAEITGCEERMACKQTISRIERGDREITLREAMVFAYLFGVRTEDLFPELRNRFIAIRKAPQLKSGTPF